ncbi:hypothetical protein HETIRDRAFT_409992 [Heterobasidion irregulare TC 32-1]|uniref:Uncharacterized protein n=1 Tax=Heterobasidion irregulare (strain TC 32-1) TaxID=747525 RepID=W4K6B6_HETIT|nr:uncharacterized protein HETIRDRAFT_409992 [Heterobasidion irregulare TC 32-1]ETW80616.1 hypothetical protein HETIRDRAFT_409992 [Heterobasidion irregulare TC 32-1]
MCERRRWAGTDEIYSTDTTGRRRAGSRRVKGRRAKGVICGEEIVKDRWWNEHTE